MNPWLADTLARAEKAGAISPDANIAGLCKYAEILGATAWAKSEADGSPRRIALHIEDCLAAGSALNAQWQGAAVADIGAGQGLPGIVIALARPEVARVNLVERSTRRATFLRRVAIETGANAEVIEASLEELSLTGELFDAVTVRAFRPPGEALQASLPILAPAGSLLMWIGSRDDSRRPHLQALEEFAADRDLTIDWYRPEMLESRGWIAIIRRCS